MRTVCALIVVLSPEDTKRYHILLYTMVSSSHTVSNAARRIVGVRKDRLGASSATGRFVDDVAALSTMKASDGVVKVVRRKLMISARMQWSKAGLSI